LFLFRNQTGTTRTPKTAFAIIYMKRYTVPLVPLPK
jgi:hypothetical protein